MRRTTDRKKKNGSERAVPMTHFDPATRMEVIAFDDLATYLDVYGLRVVRAEWPAGRPRPICHMVKKDEEKR